MEKIKFLLNGCDISFIAEAPKDITLEQLLKQCSKIKPMWCACGIRNLDKVELKLDEDPDIIIDYNTIKKASEDVSCEILEDKEK